MQLQRRGDLHARTARRHLPAQPGRVVATAGTRRPRPRRGRHQPQLARRGRQPVDRSAEQARQRRGQIAPVALLVAQQRVPQRPAVAPDRQHRRGVRHRRHRGRPERPCTRRAPRRRPTPTARATTRQHQIEQRTHHPRSIPPTPDRTPTSQFTERRLPLPRATTARGPSLSCGGGAQRPRRNDAGREHRRSNSATHRGHEPGAPQARQSNASRGRRALLPRRRTAAGATRPAGLARRSRRRSGRSRAGGVPR